MSLITNYLAQFEANGMTASGINPDTVVLVEIVEVKEHPFFYRRFSFILN